jgi:hypothetical protein
MRNCCAEEIMGRGGDGIFKVLIDINKYDNKNNSSPKRPLYFHWSVNVILSVLICQNKTPLFPLDYKPVIFSLIVINKS